MLIDYDSQRRVFVARFSQDFHGDLEVCKQAKFMTSGPPDWIWYAPPPGLPALERIRKNKPASGLTITDAAYAIYEKLAEAKVKNDETRKLMKTAQKAAKKSTKKSISALEVPTDPEYPFFCIGPKGILSSME
jgi:hypothetical protein